jgi:osmoprotectant transport system permease protein
MPSLTTHQKSSSYLLRTLRALTALALGVATLPAAYAADTLKLGSKRFTESYILAQIIAQKAAPHTPTQVLQGLGNTAIVYEALRSGSIDMYAEYEGTINLEILKNTTPVPLAQLKAQLAPLGLNVDIALGFNDGYALAMREDTAKRLNITSLSDMAKHPELRLGLSNEFIGRADGWKGLAQRYGFTAQPQGIDHGLAYDAIAKQQMDVMDIYTTDAKIHHLGLRVLKDDLNYFPRYDAVILYRLDVPTRFPQAWQALQQLQGSINEATMIAMNARAELEGASFETIAKDHLAGKTATPSSSTQGFWGKLFGADFARLTWQHVWLVVASVLLASLIAIPLAVIIFPHEKLRALVLGATGVLQTVPSLAMLAVLISLLGAIGALPALIALTLYALLPIMRNTCAGLAEVPRGLRQSARALGLTAAQSMRHVELPLALPTIIAGVRTAAVIAVGTATIAAFIGAGGYGERIVTGLALNDRELLLAGALPAAALALICEFAFEWVERAIRRGRTEVT